MKRALIAVLMVFLTSAALSAAIGVVGVTFSQSALASDRP